MTQDRSTEISRRRVLARGATLGGAVWATPTVTAISLSPASAASPSGEKPPEPPKPPKPPEPPEPSEPPKPPDDHEPTREPTPTPSDRHGPDVKAPEDQRDDHPGPAGPARKAPRRQDYPIAMSCDYDLRNGRFAGGAPAS